MTSRTMATFPARNLTCMQCVPETLSRPATYGRGVERHRYTYSGDQANGCSTNKWATGGEEDVCEYVVMVLGIGFKGKSGEASAGGNNGGL